MPDETKDNDLPDDELDEDIDDDSAADKKEGDTEKKPVKKKSGKFKWIFIVFVLLIIAVAGVGKKFAPEYFKFLDFIKIGPADTPEITIEEDNLSEEILSPFILPPGDTRGAVRIDLSIVWDGIAAIRFRKNEMGIRQMMYDRFYEIAEESTDLEEKIPFMENEISSLLRKSLGVQNLVIRIKEIRQL